jgi:hypothetical protein
MVAHAIISATWEVEIGGQFENSLGKKVTRTLSQRASWAVVTWVCNPSYGRHWLEDHSLKLIWSFLPFFFFIFDRETHYVARLVPNLVSSCLCLPSGMITGVCYQAQLEIF